MTTVEQEPKRKVEKLLQMLLLVVSAKVEMGLLVCQIILIEIALMVEEAVIMAEEEVEEILLVKNGAWGVEEVARPFF